MLSFDGKNVATDNPTDFISVTLLLCTVLKRAHGLLVVGIADASSTNEVVVSPLKKYELKTTG